MGGREGKGAEEEGFFASFVLWVDFLWRRKGGGGGLRHGAEADEGGCERAQE